MARWINYNVNTIQCDKQLEFVTEAHGKMSKPGLPVEGFSEEVTFEWNSEGKVADSQTKKLKGDSWRRECN